MVLGTTEATMLANWYESVLEKPEGIALEGLCPVSSSMVDCIKGIKPGYCNPRGGRPVLVPGPQWPTVMVAGMSDPPTLVLGQACIGG